MLVLREITMRYFLLELADSFLGNIYQIHLRQHTLNCLRHTAFNPNIVNCGKNTRVRFSLSQIARQDIKLYDFSVFDIAISKFANV